MNRRFIPASLCLATMAATHAATPSSPAKVEFSRDVRPILSENCFACHGFDKAARKADLRLDTKEGALATKDGVTAIVPGKPEASELIARIMSDDPDEVMPTKKSGKHLTAAQKETLKRWIEQGATYQRHWSFEPPKRPAVPEAQGSKVKAQNPIDGFIVARLEKDGLAPSLLADATVLIRRVALDLTGLPPTPAEVDAFVKASAKDPEAAYRDLVERLLKPVTG